MRHIIIAFTLAGIFGVPAKAFDGTPSPNNPPIGKPVPLDLPFGRRAVCGYAGVCHDLSAQANPSGAAKRGVGPKRTPLGTLDAPPGYQTVIALTEVPPTVPNICVGRHTNRSNVSMS